MDYRLRIRQSERQTHKLNFSNIRKIHVQRESIGFEFLERIVEYFRLEYV